MPKDKEKNKFWKVFSNLWTVSRIIAVLLGIAGFAGLLPIPGVEGRLLPPYWDEFIRLISPELIGIAIVVLVIDIATEQRSTQQLKESLILQMGSPSNEFAREAIRVLWHKGWLIDGSLNKKHFWRANLYEAELAFAQMRGAEFTDANLESANLNQTDLRGAILHGVNLINATLVNADLRNAEIYTTKLENTNFFMANLHGAQFMVLRNQGEDNIRTDMNPDNFLYLSGNLQLATMPDGSRYDGRYCLQGDEEKAGYTIDINNEQAMADFYQVTLDDYLEGQRWYGESGILEKRSHAAFV